MTLTEFAILTAELLEAHRYEELMQLGREFHAEHPELWFSEDCAKCEALGRVMIQAVEP